MVNSDFIVKLQFYQSPINPDLIPSCCLSEAVNSVTVLLDINTYFVVTVTEMVTQDGTEAISRPQPLFRNNFWVMTSFLDIYLVIYC